MLTTSIPTRFPPRSNASAPLIIQVHESTEASSETSSTPSTLSRPTNPPTESEVLPGSNSARRTPADDLVPGYPRLAGFMSLVPETVILRRFTALNVQNRLYLQAELKHLETKLRAQEDLDAQTVAGKRQMYARDWFWLSVSEEDEDGRQWRIVKRIREVLKEYNEALLQQHELIKLHAPSHSALQTVQDWLARPTGGRYSLIGRDCRIWGYRFTRLDMARNLIAPCTTNVEDRFSLRFLQEITSPLRHSLPLLREEVVLAQLQRRTVVSRTTSFLTGIAASVVVLYELRSMTARLGVMAGFNALFAFLLSGFATVKRSEVFAATAAFAAIQVVFIGTSGSDGGGYGTG